ncbi:UBX domain-containing protein 1 [Terramyces sp. JEL0728]|nr:UBX domain-containing protein 1 [Terramyces sp. JEL0728]
MGFPESKVLKALKKTNNAGLQPAMDWILAHQDDPDVESEEDTGEITADQQTAQSLKCDDCGKLLRDVHAVKTGHVNFSESIAQIKPLTEEEKKQKVKDLEARVAIRREEKRQEREREERQKETVRRTTGAEMQLIREKLQQEEMQKQVEARKRQKEEDRIAKERVRKQLEADKLERHRQAEERKRLAEGKPAPVQQPVVQAVQQPTKDYNETRIQIRVPNGAPITKVFNAEDKLSAVYDFVKLQYLNEFKLMQTFPRKVLDGPCLNQSLKELGLVPSAALVVQ